MIGLLNVLKGFSPHRRRPLFGGLSSLRRFGELKLWITLWLACASLQARNLDVVIVRGADGEEDFGKKFTTQVEAWKTACAKSEVPVEVIAGPETTAKLEKRLASSKADRSLWLVLIGHGTFDGREAMFNAEGPDFDAKQLAGWLAPLKQEVAVIHTASSSGGFVRPLSGKGRIVITSTKSPDEVFYARFGEYFAEAIGGLLEADLDQDKQVSLLEAFRHASKSVAMFYDNDGRLATEHALLEDNGDGVPTRREALEAPPADAKLDGERAAQLVLVLSDEEKKLTDEQRTKRDALEAQIKKLRGQQAALGDEAYYAQLEKLLRELAAVYAGA